MSTNPVRGVQPGCTWVMHHMLGITKVYILPLTGTLNMTVDTDTWLGILHVFFLGNTTKRTYDFVDFHGGSRESTVRLPTFQTYDGMHRSQVTTGNLVSPRSCSNSNKNQQNKYAIVVFTQNVFEFWKGASIWIPTKSASLLGITKSYSV